MADIAAPHNPSSPGLLSKSTSHRTFRAALAAIFNLTIHSPLGYRHGPVASLPPQLLWPPGAPMFSFEFDRHALVGDAGSLTVPAHDEIARKLAMLIEGNCQGFGPTQAAAKYGFTKQRYFQLRHLLQTQGAQ